MVDTHHNQQQQDQQKQQTTVSRLGIKNSGGKIVEVQGGHIVRSTGRKDRHSKVCTAKGPRDRRLRLSAHTAIQFYDVQDRLGYDRPSKAVDWLIKKAKLSIDELAELPPRNPTSVSLGNSTFNERQFQKQLENNLPQQQQQFSIHNVDVVDTSTSSNPHNGTHSSFLPPSLDSDSIADTIRSFFPIVAATEANSSAIPFQSFPPQDCNLLSRTNSQNQDLRLSLQSFQNSILFQHSTNQNEQQTLFSGTNPLGFNGSGWSENQSADVGRFQKMVAWNSGEDNDNSGGCGGGFVFNSPPMLQPFFGQMQLFSQRGPLQSSSTPSIRTWMDQSEIGITTSADNHRHHRHEETVLPVHPSSISGIGFASGGGEFSRFRIPARIQGDEEEHDGISNKPSSASSDSCH